MLGEYSVPLTNTVSQGLSVSGGSDGKESACNAGDLCWEDPLGKGMAGYPPQYSCLENPMDRGAWWTTVLGVSLNKLDTTK